MVSPDSVANLGEASLRLSTVLICASFTMDAFLKPWSSPVDTQMGTRAQALWDIDLIEIPGRTADEPRFIVIGKTAGSHWSGVITYRGDAMRIIWVRRSREEE